MKAVVVVFLILLTAGAVYLFSRQSPSQITKISTIDTSVSNVLPTSVNQEDRYVEYTPDLFADHSNQKRVLFFYASWCPTCRPANAEFESRAGEIPEGVILFRTDYDKETALKQKYNITYQHTFVLVDAQGLELKKWNGGAMSELLKNTQ